MQDERPEGLGVPAAQRADQRAMPFQLIGHAVG